MSSMMSTFLAPKAKPGNYISTSEAVKRAGVSVPTIIRWCERYEIGTRVAGRWRVDPNKLDKLLSGAWPYPGSDKR